MEDDKCLESRMILQKKAIKNIDVKSKTSLNSFPKYE